jgi:esterase
LTLHFQEYKNPRADAPSLIILHGLLGSSDNWHSLAREWSKRFHVFSLDARNHGRSPHSDEFDYEVMANDVRQFMTDHGLRSANALGHSMGGKTAMELAFSFPQLVDRLIIVDIAPKEYEPHHEHIFEALFSLDLTKYSSRRQVEEALTPAIPNPSTRQFLLKNLRRTDVGSYEWKMNLDVINQHYGELNRAVQGTFDKPTLFVRGERSDYIVESDLRGIKLQFPSAIVETIAGAGHWVHADAPAEIGEKVAGFLRQ